MSINFFRYALLILFVTLPLIFIGCGGGGGSGGGTGGTVVAPTYAVTGKVVDVTGNGVPGVTVSISSTSAKLVNKAVASTVLQTTTTDAGGNYAFQVANGTYTISSGDSRYVFAPISVAVNGKAETTVQVAASSAFTLTGKVTQADGTPTAGLTVKLYKASFSIYSGAMYNGSYGTKNPTSGVESVKKVASDVRSVLTNDQGIYSFTGVSGGSYTIEPSGTNSFFTWTLDPSRSDTGVISITASGMVYLYNPDEPPPFANNKLSAGGTIIYNNSGIFSLDGGATSKFDFKKSSGSGGILIQF